MTIMQDRFGNLVVPGSWVAIASRQGSCGAELKIRQITAVDREKGYAVYLTPNKRREKLFQHSSDRWLVIGGGNGPGSTVYET